MGVTILAELAALSETIKKAATVSPGSKDPNYTKIGGIVIEIDPISTYAVVMSTDHDVWYREESQAIESVTGYDPDSIGFLRYRFSTPLLAGYFSTLKPKAGDKLKIEIDGMVAKFSVRTSVMTTRLLLCNEYPTWADDSKFIDSWIQVDNLGRLINEVGYAADDADTHLGVRIASTYVAATNRGRFAMHNWPDNGIPDNGFTIPTRALVGVLHNMGEVNLALLDKMLILQPDEFTSIRVRLIEVVFPDIRSLVNSQFPGKSAEVTFSKNELSDIITRVMKVDKDEFNIVELILGDEEVAAYRVEDGDINSVGDLFETPGQCVHERVWFYVNGAYLIEALSHAPHDEVTLTYDEFNGSKGLKLREIRIISGDYTAMIAQRVKPKGK